MSLVQVMIGAAISAAALIYISQILINAMNEKKAKEQVINFVESFRIVNDKWETGQSCKCSLLGLNVIEKQATPLVKVSYFDKHSSCSSPGAPLLHQGAKLSGFTIQGLSLENIRAINNQEVLATLKVVATSNGSSKRTITNQRTLRLETIKQAAGYQVIDCKDYPASF